MVSGDPTAHRATAPRRALMLERSTTDRLIGAKQVTKKLGNYIVVIIEPYVDRSAVESVR